MDQKFGFESLNDEIFQSKVKSKLKSKLFIGDYKSKSLCESLKTYRDVIDIDVAEKEIHKDLNEFLSELAESQRVQIFCGITKNEENLTLWTELDEEVAFGKYWWQIKTIKFRFNEIQVKLRKIRSVEESDNRTFAEKLKDTTKVHDGSKNSTNSPDQSNNFDDVYEPWKILYEFWSREISAAVAWMLSLSINRQSILETLRFISLLIVSLFAGSTQIVKYTGIFIIKLIERTTWLVHVLTPIAMAIIDLCSKIVGGLYLLIAMIWRDSTGGARRPQPNAIEYGSQNRPRPIEYKRYEAKHATGKF